MRSRVVPAMSVTMATSSPARAFIIELLPTFGEPTRMTFKPSLRTFPRIAEQVSSSIWTPIDLIFSFTWPSRTKSISSSGKSTHAALWLKHFGERAAIINDDKPIIRRMDGVFNAYGTPWCGEKNIGNNIKAPLKAIAFLERSNENSIERMEPKEAFDRLFRQTLHRIASKSGIDALLVQLDELIKAVPIYVLRCSISDEAVKVAYGAMSERASE